MPIDGRQLLSNQRRRTIASIMGYAEAEIYSSLTPAQRAAFRDKVIGAVGAYHDVMLDLIGSMDGVVNEEVFVRLEQIHSRLVEMDRPTRPRTVPRAG